MTGCSNWSDSPTEGILDEPAAEGYPNTLSISACEEALRCNSGAGLADGRGIDSVMDGRVSSILNLFAGRGTSCSLSESSMIIGAFFLPRTSFGGCSSAWTDVPESESLLLCGIFCLYLVGLALCGV